MKNLFLIAFLSLSLSHSIFSQKGNTSIGTTDLGFGYGKISQTDLDMKVYPLDTSADAVILNLKGQMSIEINSQGDYFLIEKKFVRIKFFKKSAFMKYGTVQIAFNEDNEILLKTLKAAVVQTNGTRQELTTTDFIDEKTTDDYKIKKFTFPNLTEGCIIEFEYTQNRYYNYQHYIYQLPLWFFQDLIPVKHSELITYLPVKYDYHSIIKGNQKIKSETNPRAIYNGIQVVLSRFSADSVPALKEESYISTLNEYLSQIEFLLKGVNYPNGTRDTLDTWRSNASYFLKRRSVGQQYLYFENYSHLWYKIKPLLNKAETDDEKIQIVYNFLCKNMTWDKDAYSVYSHETLNDLFEKKVASSGELNLMMIACLKEAGIKSSPILISTRSNGKPITDFPIRNQFNHLACYIDRNEKSLIIDVGSELRPLGIPRKESLNEQGWILDPENVRWVSIVPPPSSYNLLVNFKFDSDNTLKGSIATSAKGYEALDERTEEAELENHEKYKKKLQATFLEIKVDSITSENLQNLNEPFKRRAVITLPNAVTSTDNFLFFKPMFIKDFAENPFKLPKRDYPIEFTFPFKDQYVFNITIPEGYTVDEMPKPIIHNLPSKAGSFQYISSVTGNVIQLVVKLQINQLVYQPEDYGIVKDFFNQVANKLSEQIVLKRTNSK